MPQFSKSALLAQISALVANGDVTTQAGVVLGNMVDSLDESLLATVTITFEQIRNCFTDPIDIVPAQGVGTFIVPSLVVYEYQYGGTQFVIDDDIGLKFTTPTEFIASIEAILSSGTASSVTFLQDNGETAENEPLQFTANNANPTTGNGTLVVNVFYRVINL